MPKRHSYSHKTETYCTNKETWRASNQVTFRGLFNIVKGLFVYRKMMRRKDFIKILFVGVCICHVCPAHPCGDNPMRFVNNFAHSQGIGSASMLHFMRLNTPTDYSVLMKEYRRYLECTQMVHNGYFKRSVDHVLNQNHKDALPSPFKEAALLNTKPRVWEDSTLNLLKQDKDRDLKMNKNRIRYMGYRLKLAKRDLYTPESETLLEAPSQHTPSLYGFQSLLKRHLDSLLDQDRRQTSSTEHNWSLIDTIKGKR